MIGRLVMAIIAGVIVFLVCVLLGALLTGISVPFVVTIGDFLRNYAGLLGLLAALAHFFGGGPTFFDHRRV